MDRMDFGRSAFSHIGNSVKDGCFNNKVCFRGSKHLFGENAINVQ